MHLNAVLLPDRTVLVCGGAEIEESAIDAALNAEVYDPVAAEWSVMAAARVPRLYHSVALLMPDGKVITAGSNPQRKTEELRIEVYSPPYLFRGPRPTCAVNKVEVTYGESVEATIPDAAASLRWLSLIRPGATTHSMNNEQRLLEASFNVIAPDQVEWRLPTDPTLAPPGWYLLFAADTANRPSKGVWLHLT